MADSYIDNYKSKHRHPLNKACHIIGIPMITIAWPLFFFKWRWALMLFVLGWILQFVGHAIEGISPPSFRIRFTFLSVRGGWFGVLLKQLAFLELPRQNSPMQRAGQ
jgi:hypothetical protein